MTSVAVRELRNHTRQVLDRVRAGESVIVTVDGRPAAVIGPLHERPRFMEKASFCHAWSKPTPSWRTIRRARP